MTWLSRGAVCIEKIGVDLIPAPEWNGKLEDHAKQSGMSGAVEGPVRPLSKHTACLSVCE